MKAPLPKDEDARLAALHSYDVLDTAPDATFDDLTELAAHICEAPIALITLLDEDRQWFKSRVGLSATETSRDIAFCAHAIHQPELFIVSDASRDPRFADNELVTDDPKIRFYAGAPLVTPEGHALGTLCVIDRVPRQMSAEHQKALRVLSRHVMAQMELRRRSLELAQATTERDDALTALRREQAAIAARDKAEEMTRQLLAEADQARLALLSLLEDQKKADAALRASEQKYRQIIETTHEGVWQISADARTTYVNPRMAEMLGYTPDEMLGHGIFEFMDEQARTGAERNLARRASGISEQLDFRFRHKDGSDLWAILATNPVLDAQGAYAGSLGMVTDITERKRAEDSLRDLSQRLLQAEDDERRRIAKDLHDSTAQNLIAVMMDLEALRESLSAHDPKSACALEDGIALVEHSANEIRTLAYVLHPPRLNETGLAGALTEYAAGFATRTDTRIHVEPAADFGRLPEDVELVLFRVAQEGLANVLRHAASDTAIIRLVRTDGNAVLEIQDHGRGMAPTAAGGVGIAGMRERLQQLGGRLEIESDSAGTTVRAVLPLAEPGP